MANWKVVDTFSRELLVECPSRDQAEAYAKAVNRHSARVAEVVEEATCQCGEDREERVSFAHSTQFYPCTGCLKCNLWDGPVVARV